MNSANTISHSHLVIMAGGIGSRFWPMSTPERPKQFVAFEFETKLIYKWSVSASNNSR